MYIYNGSLARNESGSYTDFEVGVLLEKNTIEAQMYFTEFAQKLSECLYLLGEHPDIGGKGAHLDVADNAPYHKRFEFRNLSENKISNKLRKAIGNRQIGSIPKLPIGGSRVYLLEYRSFAKLFQNEFIDNLKLNGIPELSEDYREKFELHLEEIIERIKN